MAKKIINKRVIAILLTLVMLFNGLQIIGTAVENDEFSLVQNFADTYYKQDGSAGSASDWEIHLSKIAAPAGKDTRAIFTSLVFFWFTVMPNFSQNETKEAIASFAFCFVLNSIHPSSIYRSYHGT